MQYGPQKRLAAMFAAGAVALMLIGCKGDTGATGANGTNGTNGTTGATGTNGTNGANGQFAIDAATMSNADWINLQPMGTITSVTTAGQPVVNFKITDKNGNGIKNLDTFTKLNPATDLTASYPNFAFALSRLEPSSNIMSGTTLVGTVPSKWVSYLVLSTPNVKTPTAVAQKPGTDINGVLVGHGDGTYTYTFFNDITKTAAGIATIAAAGTDVSALGDVSFSAANQAKPHRLTIEFYGNARGTGSGSHANTPDGSNSAVTAEIAKPINIIYDFVPATGAAPMATDPAREIVNVSDCNACHTTFNYHGGHRVDPRYCVTCHTDQFRFGTTPTTYNAAGTAFATSPANVNGTSQYQFDQLVHQIHMGDSLKMAGHDVSTDSAGLVTNVTYPQNVMNCATCHVAGATAPQTGNWNTVPSRAACGGCHDNVNFVTGKNHSSANLAMANDASCVSCHNATNIDITLSHVPTVVPDATNGGLTVAQGGVASNTHTNSSYLSGNFGNVTPGVVALKWNLKSVTINATNNPVFVFNYLTPDGKPVVFNTYSATGAVTQEMVGPLANYGNATFVGSPAFIIAWSSPQDGIAKPADFNKEVTVALRAVWRGASALNTMTGPDANGYYTATLGNFVLPANLNLVSGGIGYTYGVVAAGTTQAIGTTDSLQMTQTNLAAFPYNTAVIAGTSTTVAFQGGITTPANNVWVTAQNAAGTKFASRRAIVDPARCSTCHAQLGTFTDSTFHSSQRNDANTCIFCHNPNGVDATSGAYNIKDAVHSLHASSKRMNPFSWEVGSGHAYWNTTYPAKLNNCEACHVPGAYDFQNSATTAALPNMLWSTVASGAIPFTDATGKANFNVFSAANLGANGQPTLAAGNNAVSPLFAPNVVSNTYSAANLPNYLTVLGATAASTTGTANYGAGFTVNTSPAAPSTTYVVPLATAITNAPLLTAAKAKGTLLAAGATYEAEGGTLVNSPISAACYACHDSSTARAHMVDMGGALNSPRSSWVTNTNGVNVTPIASNEQCLICHGAGTVADIQAVHMNF